MKQERSGVKGAWADTIAGRPKTLPAESVCALTPTEPEPCTIVIFGASGDLTAGKLIPALYNLYLNGILPAPFSIVGCARTALSNLEFINRLKNDSLTAHPANPDQWEQFAVNLHYHQIDYDSPSSYATLADYLKKLDKGKGARGNRLFHLAVPPDLYPKISEMLGRAGLAAEKGGGNGWSRIVVEKPFGRDLKSAKVLDGTLHLNFLEHQIFRIDHYLAKETVQNIIMLRFANTIFEPVWNRNYIDYVSIMAAEKLGVKHRAGYYEQAGVIRDMFQNHLMQLMALTAMEPPSLFNPDYIQDEKVKVFRAVKPFTKKDHENDLILGQYGPGIIDKKQVCGYLDEPGVEQDSLTPTFAVMRLFVDNWRLRGVPFYLMSGKRLPRKETKIIIHFKEVPHSMFKEVLGGEIAANRLTLGVYPEEKITLTFQTKAPGPHLCLRPMTMRFGYYQDYQAPALNAYEKVLLDCMLGDHLLFWRQDGVELTWRLLTPFLEVCETCPERRQRLHPYPAGSWGPQQAMKWMGAMMDS